MKTDVSHGHVLGNYRTEVILQDERIGHVDMTPYLDFGLFKRLL